jgi:hypothetical protein
MEDTGLFGMAGYSARVAIATSKFIEAFKAFLRTLTCKVENDESDTILHTEIDLGGTTNISEYGRRNNAR